MTAENMSAIKIEAAIKAGITMFANEDVMVPVTQMAGLLDLRNILISILNGQTVLGNPPKEDVPPEGE